MNEMKMSSRGEEASVPAGIRIREAAVDDAARLLEIYSYYVEKTAITFEYDVPSLEEFRGRITHIKERYPYLVIERSGVIEGYAYAGVFKDRAAYDRSCEMTIYLDREAVGGGLGADEYLDYNSAQFHEHLGYRTVGTFHQCGYKFGRWYSMIWMEKMIGEHK